MTFSIGAPVSLPRFTTEEFEIKKAEYTAKHGFEVHIPGFEEIFKWRIPKEPTDEELKLYRKKDPDLLLPGRYDEIKELMEEKRERFLRMLSSPTPKIIRNVTSFMTAVDDVNDTLGTFAWVAKVAAKKLPSSLGKVFSGPAGWALTGAEITNVMMALSRSPTKALRLQHELNHFASDNPFSKKAKLRRLNKLKRLAITKGELIEALQTTDNLFGIGLCLGPIFALLYDVPAGFYHHIRGEKVTITGLPKPLLWFDRVWNRAMKSAAYMWTGIDPALDDLLPKAGPAFNVATQMARSVLENESPLDLIEPIDGLEVEAPRPIHPSTRQIIEDELGDPDARVGWPHNDQTYSSLADIFDGNVEPIIDRIKSWEHEKRNDVEGFVSAQNISQSGLNVLAMLEGDDALELDYDSSVMAILKLLNQRWRFPPDVTREQGTCFFSEVEIHSKQDIELDHQELLKIAEDHCGLVFTVSVPERPGLTPEEEALRRKTTLNPLRRWYVKALVAYWMHAAFAHRDRFAAGQLYGQRMMGKYKKWLDFYGWPKGEPRNSVQALEPWRIKILARLPFFPEAF